MGNQVSTSSNNKANNNQIVSDYEYIKDTISSYKGLRSETYTVRSDSNSNVSMQTTDKTSADLENKIITPFEWKDGGNIVYVTGSFSNWKQWFMMGKNNKNNFELTLELPKGTYQFKFIVDSNWKFSKHYPTCTDERGNTNNIIDNSSFPKVANKAKEQQIKPESKEEVEKHKNEDRTEHKFTDSLPRKSEMNTDAPSVPHQYERNFYMDNLMSQKEIGNPDFLNSMKVFYLNENNSFKSVSPPSHVNLYIVY